MRLPLANKTFILIPVLFNMFLFVRLAKPYDKWEDMLLAACGMACTMVLGLAFCGAYDAARDKGKVGTSPSDE